MAEARWPTNPHPEKNLCSENDHFITGRYSFHYQTFSCLARQFYTQAKCFYDFLYYKIGIDQFKNAVWLKPQINVKYVICFYGVLRCFVVLFVFCVFYGYYGYYCYYGYCGYFGYFNQIYEIYERINVLYKTV
jgi:hypothetical protein